MALETFRIIHKISPVFRQDQVVIKQKYLYHFRFTNTAEVQRSRTTRYGINFFRYEAKKLWRYLPNAFRNLSSYSKFSKYVLD